MIGYLKGEVIFTKSDSMVIEAGGVGYLVYCPVPFLSKASGIAEVYVTTIVREDSITLYGFETIEEQAVFEKLMSVSGVGPKSALAALSVLPGSEIVNAVLTEDTAALCRIPKVGKKTAQQIILDLKDKFADMPVESTSASADAKLIGDTIDVLINLGYNRQDAKKAVTDTLAAYGIKDEAELIRLALKQIAGGR